MAHPDRLIRKSLRSRYVVSLETGESFNGVLIDADQNHLVLADATAIELNAAPTPVDGHLWLPRAGIKYLQHVSE